MSSVALHAKFSPDNPLDMAEQVLLDRDWTYDRSDFEEILAACEGSWGHYRISMNWHEAFGALTFTCAFEGKVPERQLQKLYPILAKANEKLWLGHFDVSGEDGAIAFRYAMLLKGKNAASLEQIEELLDIAVTECERFYPAFQSAIWSDKSAEEVLKLVLMDTAGEA